MFLYACGIWHKATHECPCLSAQLTWTSIVFRLCWITCEPSVSQIDISGLSCFGRTPVSPGVRVVRVILLTGCLHLLCFIRFILSLHYSKGMDQYQQCFKGNPHPHRASAHATMEEATTILGHKTQKAFASVVGPGPLQPSWVAVLDSDHRWKCPLSEC